MEKTWAIAGLDLHVDVSGSRVRAGLEAALRDAVQAGRLAAGTRLPSSRTLAADLGIARNTVADAYNQLVAEGWLTARQGSGTRVAGIAAEVVASPALPATAEAGPPLRHYPRARSPAPSSFPPPAPRSPRPKAPHPPPRPAPRHRGPR